MAIGVGIELMGSITIITVKGQLWIRDAMWRRDADRLERAPRLSPASRGNDSAVPGLIR